MAAKKHLCPKNESLCQRPSLDAEKFWFQEGRGWWAPEDESKVTYSEEAIKERREHEGLYL